MARKPVITVLTALAATLLLALPAMAQGAKTYAVLPFVYNGPQKYEYFSKAVQASLENDLEWLGHAEPSTKNLKSVTVPKDKGAALNALRGMGVDYLMYGEIAILDTKAHLRIDAVSADGKSWQKKGEVDIDQMTGWLDSQARVIQGDVFNRPGYGTVEKAQVEKNTMQAAAPSDSPFLTGDGKPFQAAALNPQFRYEGGTETTGRWRSQTLPFYSFGMYVADGDADGRNELFVLQESAISAYRFKEGKLQHLNTFELPANVMSVRLEVADLNRDGLPEFIIGAYQFENQGGIRAPRGTPRSSILTFEGGEVQIPGQEGRPLSRRAPPPADLHAHPGGPEKRPARPLRQAHHRGIHQGRQHRNRPIHPGSALRQRLQPDLPARRTGLQMHHHQQQPQDAGLQPELRTPLRK